MVLNQGSNFKGDK